MGWRGLTTGAQTHKRKLSLRKRHFCVTGKHDEDVKQEEKHTPDLEESIMKASGLVKDKLPIR